MNYDINSYIEFIDNHSKIPFDKIRLLHNNWALTNSKSIEATEKINDCFDTISHRFKSNLFYLEILWRQFENNKNEGISNPDTFNFLSLTLLESFFIQARSFIEATQNYCLLFLHIETENKDGLKGFYKLLEKSKDLKSKDILTFYKDKVFKEQCFGDNIRKIRDKIIHKGFIKQFDFENDFKKHKPLIANKTYEDFCQNFSNDLFYFLIDWTELLFEVKWKSG